LQLKIIVKQTPFNMKTRLIFLISFFLAIGLMAQEVQIDEIELRRPTELPMQIPLWQLSLAAIDGNTALMDSIMKAQGFVPRRDGKIQIQILHPRYDLTPPRQVLIEQNIEVFYEGDYATSIFILPQDLIFLAEALPEDYVLFQEQTADTTEEGNASTVHNSITYSGFNSPGGAGIKIAIIDTGFNGLLNAVANGWAPAEYDSIDYTGNGVLGPGGHGLLVLRTAFKHAPNSEYFLYKVSTVSQVISAIEKAVLIDDVDIINMSLGYRGLSWTDDDNDLCGVVNAAASLGKLIFVSSGNRKQQHWQGVFTDNNNNTWHEWAGGNELNRITLQDTTTLSINLSWDPSQETDYDLVILNQAGNQILASNIMNGTTFEAITFQNNSGGPVTIAVAVRRVSGPAVEFEVSFRTDGVGSSVTNDQFTFQVAASSISWPAICSHDNVLAVAGVNGSNFSSPPGSVGISAVYSSEGPTNEGRRGVDITGATATAPAGGGNFIGTSASAPNAAGATAAFWSSQPSLNAQNIRYLIEKKAGIYKDWGAPGPDPIYGMGGLYLIDYLENTKYVDRLVTNPTGLTSRVFQRINHAFNNIPAPPESGAIILFGNDYPSPFIPLNYLMEKNVLIQTIGGNSLIGNN